MLLPLYLTNSDRKIAEKFIHVNRKVRIFNVDLKKSTQVPLILNIRATFGRGNETPPQRIGILPVLPWKHEEAGGKMIAVIGAGPAGCYYASLVKDREVHIFEDHEQVGVPVSCTGILTDSVRRVIPDLPDELVLNTIRRFKLVAPGGKSMYVDLDKVNMILDRAAFDRHLLRRALANGAILHLGERFTGYARRGSAYEVQTNRGRYKAEMIVGADGPFSAVARAAGLYRRRSVRDRPAGTVPVPRAGARRHRDQAHARGVLVDRPGKRVHGAGRCHRP